MSAPTTLWEDTDAWSTYASESLFLHSIAADTELVVTEAGKTVLGRSIWRAEIGNPSGPTIVLVGAQHGRETASREAGLMWIRDLAYSTDPDVLTFLGAHRVVMVTTVNADGIDEPRKRNNARGVNLNRDWFELSQPETRAAKSVIRDVEPVLVIDLHEWSSELDFVFAYAGDQPQRLPYHEAIGVVTNSILDHGLLEVENAGYRTRRYTPSPVEAQGYLLTAAGALNIAAILIETRSIAEPADRVNSTYTFLEAVREWVTVNSADLVSACAISAADAVAGETDLYVPSREPDGSPGPWVVVPDPGEYIIPEEADIPYELFALHGIELVGRTVSTLQASRGVIPSLLDPASIVNIIDNPWSSDPVPLVAQDAMFGGLVVERSGMKYPVQSLVTKQSGVKYMVAQLVKKAQGVKHPFGGG